MVLWVFDGNMVGKWTNEPCNGVDEVVNHFWVLTIDLEKIEAMRCWLAPIKLTDVKIFVALAGSYKRFIEEYFAGKIESMYGLRKPTYELVVPRGNGPS